jgi:hypothetical protein
METLESKLTDRARMLARNGRGALAPVALPQICTCCGAPKVWSYGEWHCPLCELCDGTVRCPECRAGRAFRWGGR